MTQPEQVGDHRVTLTQAEKHQVPQVQQQAQQQEPWYQVPQAQQRAQQQEPRHQVPQVPQRAEQQVRRYQVPQVQQRAQQQGPRCPSSCGTEQERFVLPVQMSQAEKHQAEQLPVQLGPSSALPNNTP